MIFPNIAADVQEAVFYASAGIPSGPDAFPLCSVRIVLRTSSSVGVLQLTSSGFSAGRMFDMLLGGGLLSTPL